MELKWFKDNHVISSRMDISEKTKAISDDRFASVLTSQIPYGKVEPQINQWTEIINTISESLQEAIYGEKTAEEALSTAHGQINTILGGEKID